MCVSMEQRRNISEREHTAQALSSMEQLERLIDLWQMGTDKNGWMAQKTGKVAIPK